MILVIKMGRTYACIDLKSFYASVEAKERGFDPIDVNLVVADTARSEKTICLAISPTLKRYGLPGRARLFEVNQIIKDVNNKRRKQLKGKTFNGKSCFFKELSQRTDLAVDYVIATPRMSLYIEYSSRIYNIYLKYMAPDDIHVYSIDEVFCDITDYLKILKLSPEEFVRILIKEVYKETGITATAGIGTNLYLAKVAMDIVAKKMEADEHGVRVGVLDEEKYKRLLWDHQPITDFWRVGKGYAKKLEKYGFFTMGDIARCSIENEGLLYKLFGVNAEYLIDHAWGIEVCTMKDIKTYKPNAHSIGSAQVLRRAYNYSETKLVVKEMTDSLCLTLIRKRKATNKINLSLGYDIGNLNENYTGDVVRDFYGRWVPKPTQGTINIGFYTNSGKVILEKMVELFEKIMDRDLLVKRINISFGDVLELTELNKQQVRQLNLFTFMEEQVEETSNFTDGEIALQETLLVIKEKYGKNAILRGMNFVDGATTMERNGQIGGHKA